MQIALHIGAHFTEEERFMKSLLRNKAGFAAHGIAVPGPGKYRELLRKTLASLQTNAPTLEARGVLLDAFLDGETPERVILSNAHFAGPPRYALRDGLLYPSTAERLRSMCTLFPEDQIELFFAMRNPATFVPAMVRRTGEVHARRFLGNATMSFIHWSTLVQEIRETAPNIRMTLWCNEDLPLIWGRVIRQMAGLDHSYEIVDDFEFPASLMSSDGMQRFHEYMAAHPGMTEAQERRVIAAFLDKFAREDALEEELDMPGWTEILVSNLTDQYDADVERIAGMPGVKLLEP